MRASLIVVVLALGACVPPVTRPQVLRTGRASLAGDIFVDRATGQVVLLQPTNQHDCTEERRYPNGYLESRKVPCSIDWTFARLTAPWGRTFSGADLGEGRIGFAVDWKSTGLDALDSDHPELLTRAWRFSSPDVDRTREWTPDRATQQVMLECVGKATGTETEVGDEATPPQLVVGEARFDGDLRNGAPNQLTVTLSNKGAGTAYRVRLVTRSNIPVLHGLRMTFGRLAPGESRTRRMGVTLPRDNREDEAVVVLGIEEAHGAGLAQASVRAHVLPAIDRAILRVECRVEGPPGTAARVDAGARFRLGCDVHNDGSPAQGVRLHAGYPGRKGGVDSPPFDVEGKSTSHVIVALDVPREAAIDSQLAVEVSVVDNLGVRAATSLELSIANPRICPQGRLTREQFLEKRAALRQKHDAGLISDADYQRYEDELIGCMTL